MNIKGARFWGYLLALLLMPGGLRAQFTTTTNNGVVVITGYTGPGGSVTIPGTSNGLPVSVGDFAFYNQATLTNLTIMAGVVEIGGDAFDTCVNLTSVAIPGSVTNIGAYAFEYCPSLTNLVISNGVANIAEGAFRLTKLESISIPGSVTNIGPSAFEVGSYLESVFLSNGVERIGSNAFFDCGPIHSVFIPASVVSIGVGAFQDCSFLTNIAVDGSNSNYASGAGVLFDKTLTTLVEFPGGGNGSLSYVVPTGVTSIGDSAFALCNLTNITIPNSVTILGNSAFNGCDQLPSIAIPSSVTNIGASALSFCLDMTNIVVDSNNPSYASVGGVLFDKTCQTLIRYPAGNTGNYAISNGVLNIGSEAFESSELSHVTIPTSVTNVADWAFGYSQLTDVTIPGSVRNIGSYVFLNCNFLTNVTVLDGVTNIDTWAFAACNELITVTIPASLRTIGVFAFDDSPSLTNVFFLGDAPEDGSNTVFTGDPGTVYYLPGTSGWTNAFGGLPTAVWNPSVQTGNAGFGVMGNQFGFDINWISGQTVVVEACTNLSNPVWLPVQTNTLTGGTAHFTDPQWTNYPGRFYRLQPP